MAARHRGVAMLFLTAAALAGGCASPSQVQTLATGRAGFSAYALTGDDPDRLRQEARRLCPLGGEVVRQSSQGTPRPEVPDARWRRMLQTATLWVDPPVQSAQLVVVCRDAGDAMRLAPATAPMQAALPRPAASAAEPAAAPELSVALPVGPVTPEW